MRSVLAIIIIVSIILFIATDMQDINMQLPDEIVTAITNGDAEALSSFMGTTVDMTILDKSSTYNKNQAKIILADFFTTNPPSKFEISHQGTQGETSFAIGKLTSKSGKEFQVYCMTKTTGDKIIISTLKIEN